MNSFCFPPFYPALVSGAQRKTKKDSLRSLRLCGEKSKGTLNLFLSVNFRENPW
jgi:hypothetical protein